MRRALPFASLEFAGPNFGKVPQQAENLIMGLSWARKGLPFQPNCTAKQGKKKENWASTGSTRELEDGRRGESCLCGCAILPWRPRGQTLPPRRRRRRRHRSGERSSLLGGTSFDHPPKFSRDSQLYLLRLQRAPSALIQWTPMPDFVRTSCAALLVSMSGLERFRPSQWRWGDGYKGRFLLGKIPDQASRGHPHTLLGSGVLQKGLWSVAMCVRSSVFRQKSPYTYGTCLLYFCQYA